MHCVLAHADYVNAKLRYINIYRYIDIEIYRYVDMWIYRYTAKYIYKGMCQVALMHGQKWLEPDELLTRRQIHVLSSCLMHGRKCLEPDELH